MPTTQPIVRFEKVAVDNGGTYWRSKASYGVIRKHLQDMACTGFFKTAAGVGGQAEAGFEQAFSSLAYAYVKDKSPRLLDYMLGFQLVDRNEDNTKAMGIFGFLVGDQWLYAPVFFLNGDLKGHELLYIKKQDSFVPMKENWVNYLMSRRPHVLGEATPKDTYQLGGLSPDIYGMSVSPTTGIGKRGSDQFDDWVKPALPLIAAMRLKYAKAIYATAKPGTKLAFDQVVSNPWKAALIEVAPAFDMNRVMPQSMALLNVGFQAAQRYPTIKQGFDRFYGPDCFSRWANEHKAACIRGMTNLFPEQKKQATDQAVYPGSSILPDAQLPEHPIKTGELKIHVYEHTSITQNLDDLDDKDREKLLKDTVLIKDERDPQGPKASKAYNTQIKQQLTNPSETGFYEVLEKPGTFARLLVISNPLANDGQQNFCTVIRIGDGDKSWLNAHRSNIWADKIELREDFDKWFDKQGDKDSLKKGGTYIAIDARGNGTTPFVVTETYGDGAYKVDFKSNCDYSYRRLSTLPNTERDSFRSSCDDYVSNYGAKLYVDAEGKKGSKLRAIQGEMRVPAAFKFVQLKAPPKPKKEEGGFCMPCCDSCEDSGSEDKPIQPGNLVDLQMLFHEKQAKLRILSDHNEVVLRGFDGDHRFTKRAALISLVRDHGFTEKVAREMITTSDLTQAQSYWVRYAPGFGDKRHLTKQAYAPNESSLDGGPGAPYMTPPQYGMEMMGRNAVRSQYPDESHTMVPELDSSMYDRRHQNMWQNYTYEDFQQAQGQANEAAQSGQKEVFDTSMIQGMLKSVRQDSSVDKYLGDLMKALDRLGRILFLFYWHAEEFEDRYGKASMPEMEDSLRNSFEGLGEITLFLKKKQVEPNFEGEAPADPDIEASARV